MSNGPVDKSREPAMLEGRARVVSARGGTIKLESSRLSACQGCAVSSACTSAKLVSVFGDRRSSVTLKDTVGACAGDSVTIGMPVSSFNNAVLMVYLVPTLLLVAAAGVASAVGFGDAATAVAGCCGLALGLGLARYAFGKPSWAASIMPQVIAGAHDAGNDRSNLTQGDEVT